MRATKAGQGASAAGVALLRWVQQVVRVSHPTSTFGSGRREVNVGWAIDGTPKNPGFKSASCSLNYNNGSSYPGKTTGTATSKTMNMPKISDKAELQFWSYHGVETSVSYDMRYVEVSGDKFKTMTSVLIPNNVDSLKWVQKKVSLDKYKGQAIQVRFRFDSKDSLLNATVGWFIDDLKVVASTKKAGGG